MLIVAGLAFLSFMNGTSQPGTGLQIGDKAPLINQHLIDGPEFDIESLKGKMVLIDFWASYDAPSRIDNFRKKMLLEQYANSEFLNSEGFVIVSVSLDRFKAPLFRSIERDGLQDFYHLCDFNGLESQLAATFGINGQLTNFLIDGEGRIVEKSVSLDLIEATLDRLESTDRQLFAAYRK
jgi:peroxiredoxin